MPDYAENALGALSRIRFEATCRVNSTMRQLPLIPPQRRPRTNRTRGFHAMNVEAARLIVDSPNKYPGLPQEWARAVLNIGITQPAQNFLPCANMPLEFVNPLHPANSPAPSSLDPPIRQGF